MPNNLTPFSPPQARATALPWEQLAPDPYIGQQGFNQMWGQGGGRTMLPQPVIEPRLPFTGNPTTPYVGREGFTNFWNGGAAQTSLPQPATRYPALPQQLAIGPAGQVHGPFDRTGALGALHGPDFVPKPSWTQNVPNPFRSGPFSYDAAGKGAWNAANKPLTGLKNAGGSMIAQALAGGLRDQFLFRGNRVLDTQAQPGQIASAGTAGAVLGIPLAATSMGAPAAVAAGVGAGAGQAGVQGLHNLSGTGVDRWAQGGEAGNMILDNPLSNYLFGVDKTREGSEAYMGSGAGILAPIRGVIGGAANEYRDRTPDQLDVPSALAEAGSKIPVLGGALQLAGVQTNSQKAEAQAAANAQQADITAKANKINERGNQAMIPGVIDQVALKMGMHPDDVSQLSSEWNDEVKRQQVLLDEGLLTYQAEEDDPKNPGKKVKVTKQVTKDQFPAFIANQYDGLLSELPSLAKQNNAARKQEEAQSQAAMKAQMQAEQQRQLQAFGLQASMMDVMGPQYAQMAQNPALAPYVGFMQQGALNAPYNMFTEMDANTAKTAQNQANVIQQQRDQQDRDYQRWLASERRKKESKDTGTDPLAASDPAQQPAK